MIFTEARAKDIMLPASGPEGTYWMAPVPDAR